MLKGRACPFIQAKAGEAVPEKGEKAKENKKGKGKGRKFLIFFIILAVLAGVSAGAYFYFKRPAGEAKEARKSGAVEMETVEMGEVVANLAGSGGAHYLRVNITLEYPRDKKLAEELKKKKHQILDSLIAVLRSKTLADVNSPGSVDSLKRDLLNGINVHLEEGQVTGIYFTDYLVQ
ncbi:MAG: flagellar basal body-associated FliL family protein [Pelotomaculum sp.]|uniref:Flagellar protein FliL n=1 Tax=Pelotomaculum thermopropionicum (strain DSM 13744 / JCM 10971 / SI) TaxID=370438 RepID=A5D0I5_PELTS|nr:flagellar basal body-associated FliL family protein [Pelotomaculum sp.]BAF60260.1 flagellar basal body-associated protein [Pelotomaculum thermopropionicum SI]